ncbi:MAG: hypothetical protein M9905_20785 [Rhizobiaceae bacterium]|nr:hypothetical protein [Rhizobiaceae bacterium]
MPSGTCWSKLRPMSASDAPVAGAEFVGHELRFPPCRQQHGHGVLGNGLRSAGRGIDLDAAPPRGLHVDIVEAGAGLDDELQIRCRGDVPGSQIQMAAHDDDLGVGKRAVDRSALDLNDLVAVPQRLDQLRRILSKQENVHRPPSVLVTRARWSRSAATGRNQLFPGAAISIIAKPQYVSIIDTFCTVFEKLEIVQILIIARYDTTFVLS